MLPHSPPTQQVVLIVDDVPANLSLLFHHLQRVNFRVLVAESGVSALEQVQYIVPDIILLDVVMPGLTGFETCARLKQNPATAHIPIIFLTSLTETVDKLRGFAAGGVDYVTKPIDVEEVLARIRTHLALLELRKTLESQNEQLDELVQRRTRKLEQANESLRKEVALRAESQQEKEKLFQLAQTQSKQLHSLVNWLTTQQASTRDQVFSALYTPVRTALEDSTSFLSNLMEMDPAVGSTHLAQLDTMLHDCLRYLKHLSAELEPSFTDADSEKLSRLTMRERELLQFLANGATSAEIASALNVADVTVRTYRGRIMKKLDIHHMPGLVKFAIRHGLTSL